MKAMGQLPTRERHFNVLEHLYGYLVELLPDETRDELLESIRDFRDGNVPLIEPMRRLKEHFSERSIEWVCNQSYLNPKREEFTLKSEVD